jgi:hypothetical protein
MEPIYPGIVTGRILFIIEMNTGGQRLSEAAVTLPTEVRDEIKV